MGVYRRSGDVEALHGSAGKVTNPNEKYDVKESVDCTNESIMKAGRCGDEDMRMNVDGGCSMEIWWKKGEDYDGRCDDEVTIVEARCCNCNNEGGNVKNTLEGKEIVVKA